MAPRGEYSVRVHAGETYGQWLILQDAAGAANKARVWCSGCGREQKVFVKSLIRGISTRCHSCAGRAAARAKGQRPSRSEPVGPGGSYHPPFVPDGAALVVVRQRLEAARRDGFDFETAWRSVLANSDGYGHALLWAEPEWRAAYERADAPRRVSAVSILCDDT